MGNQGPKNSRHARRWPGTYGGSLSQDHSMGMVQGLLDLLGKAGCRGESSRTPRWVCTCPLPLKPSYLLININIFSSPSPPPSSPPSPSSPAPLLTPEQPAPVPGPTSPSPPPSSLSHVAGCCILPHQQGHPFVVGHHGHRSSTVPTSCKRISTRRSGGCTPPHGLKTSPPHCTVRGKGSKNS